MARDTRTGGVLERMVLPALDCGGYTYRTQVNLGPAGRRTAFRRCSCRRNGRSFLLSVKSQQMSGTAEQKVPFEAICLAEAMEGGPYEKAYLVLGGEGWKLRSFYNTGGLTKHLVNAGKVEVTTLELSSVVRTRGNSDVD